MPPGPLHNYSTDVHLSSLLSAHLPSKEITMSSGFSISKSTPARHGTALGLAEY